MTIGPAATKAARSIVNFCSTRFSGHPQPVNTFLDEPWFAEAVQRAIDEFPRDVPPQWMTQSAKEIADNLRDFKQRAGEAAARCPESDDAYTYTLTTAIEHVLWRAWRSS